MALELVYTSAPKGLDRGAYGFCVVARTKGLSPLAANSLLSLAGYRRVFTQESGRSHLNPVAYSHVLISAAGATLRALARVADAGLDYSGRTNKIASFLALNSSDLVDCGPAALFSARGLFCERWEGEPQEIPTPKILPDLPDDSRDSRAWERALGDQGWAGALASTVLSNRAATLVADPEFDVLTLFQEAIALLKPEMRWRATFTTFYANFPPSARALWKTAFVGSPEERALRSLPGAMIIDLTNPSANRSVDELTLDPAARALVDRARNGESVREPASSSLEEFAGASAEDKFAAQDARVAAAPRQIQQVTAPPLGDSEQLIRSRLQLAFEARKSAAANTNERSAFIKWLVISFLVSLTLAACVAVILELSGLPVSDGFKNIVNHIRAVKEEAQPDAGATPSPENEKKPRKSRGGENKKADEPQLEQNNDETPPALEDAPFEDMEPSASADVLEPPQEDAAPQDAAENENSVGSDEEIEEIEAEEPRDILKEFVEKVDSDEEMTLTSENNVLTVFDASDLFHNVVAELDKSGGKLTVRVKLFGEGTKDWGVEEKGSEGWKIEKPGYLETTFDFSDAAISDSNPKFPIERKFALKIPRSKKTTCSIKLTKDKCLTLESDGLPYFRRSCRIRLIIEKSQESQVLATRYFPLVKSDKETLREVDLTDESKDDAFILPDYIKDVKLTYPGETKGTFSEVADGNLLCFSPSPGSDCDADFIRFNMVKKKFGVITRGADATEKKDEQGNTIRERQFFLTIFEIEKDELKARSVLRRSLDENEWSQLWGRLDDKIKTSKEGELITLSYDLTYASNKSQKKDERLPLGTLKITALVTP